jgi:hypothetical protein
MEQSFSITRHAAIRWKQRTGVKDPAELRRLWGEAWEKAVEVQIKDQYRLRQLLSHSLKDCLYFYSNPWIFVVRDGAVLTVHDNTHQKFILPK